MNHDETTRNYSNIQQHKGSGELQKKDRVENLLLPKHTDPSKPPDTTRRGANEETCFSPLKHTCHDMPQRDGGHGTTRVGLPNRRSCRQCWRLEVTRHATSVQGPMDPADQPTSETDVAGAGRPGKAERVPQPLGLRKRRESMRIRTLSGKWLHSAILGVADTTNALEKQKGAKRAAVETLQSSPWLAAAENESQAQSHCFSFSTSGCSGLFATALRCLPALVGHLLTEGRGNKSFKLLKGICWKRNG